MARDDPNPRMRLEAAERMARRWTNDDDLVVACPLCGVIHEAGTRVCSCGWDLSRTDGAQERRRRWRRRVGGGAALVLAGVAMSVVMSAADRGATWVYYGAILTGLGGIAAGVWYALAGRGGR